MHFCGESLSLIWPKSGRFVGMFWSDLGGFYCAIQSWKYLQWHTFAIFIKGPKDQNHTLMWAYSNCGLILVKYTAINSDPYICNESIIISYGNPAPFKQHRSLHVLYIHDLQISGYLLFGNLLTNDFDIRIFGHLTKTLFWRLYKEARGLDVKTNEGKFTNRKITVR